MELSKLAYSCTGYPIIAQARAMVENGDIGMVRIVHMQFSHGYHAEAVEKNDPGLAWRVTLEASGPTYVLGDLGQYLSQLWPGD